MNELLVRLRWRAMHTRGDEQRYWLRAYLRQKAKRGIWDVRMLNGCPGNIKAPVKVAIMRGVAAGLLVTATTNGRHAAGSYHAHGEAVDLGHRKPGTKAALDALKIFQRAEHRRASEYIELLGPINGLAVLRRRQTNLREGTPLEQNHDNHVHLTPRFTIKRVTTPPPAPTPRPIRMPASVRSLSTRGLNLIAGFEGFVARPYNDAAGHATIGYGHLLHYGPVTLADLHGWGTITVARGLELLDADAARFERAVGLLVTVPVSQGEFDALVSFAFNVGERALAGSTLLRLLNQSNRVEAADEFLRWNRAGGRVLAGLTRRRQAERHLFLGL